jgi:hypothetical protein
MLDRFPPILITITDKGKQMETSLQTVYDHLELLDRVDAATSAAYRQAAQELLANPEISLEWRKAISDRLNQANHDLAIHSTTDDSY